MSGPRITHDLICDLLGVDRAMPHPDWLPYASRSTRVEVFVDGHRQFVFGGSMRCGQCGFGVDIMPGPGTQHPEDIYRTICPRCGFRGPSHTGEEKK